MPDLNNSTSYTLELIDVSDESIVLSYDFKTSMFSTFAEKMAQLNITKPRTVPLNNNMFIWVVIGDMTTQEGFDEVDIVGTNYTQNKPLIVVRATMTDDYFLNQIKPLLYDPYPFDGAVTYSRKEGQSIIPDWDIVKDSWYGYGTTQYFPWVYYLARTYYQDYEEARAQINASSTAKAKYGDLFTAERLPYILPAKSNYDLIYAYTLPNGVVTDATVQKTLAVP